jgi:hypothetical protein
MVVGGLQLEFGREITTQFERVFSGDVGLDQGPAGILK